MVARWDIHNWPRKTFDIFMSHVTEDRDDLIVPVYDKLSNSGYVPWIDQADYPLGAESIEALRSNMLLCSHVVYFITPSLLQQGRGWTSAERALASVIQDHFHIGTQVFHKYQLPLYYFDSNDPEMSTLVQRSLWSPIRERGVQCPYDFVSEKVEVIKWTIEYISKFINQEQKAKINIEKLINQDIQLKHHFSRRDGLLDWVNSLGPYDIST